MTQYIRDSLIDLLVSSPKKEEKLLLPPQHTQLLHENVLKAGARKVLLVKIPTRA